MSLPNSTVSANVICLTNADSSAKNAQETTSNGGSESVNQSSVSSNESPPPPKSASASPDHVGPTVSESRHRPRNSTANGVTSRHRNHGYHPYYQTKNNSNYR